MAKRSNSFPVICYDTRGGVIVGRVRSGKDVRSGRVRHVGFMAYGLRVGTFDTFREAEGVVKALSAWRDSLPVTAMRYLAGIGYDSEARATFLRSVARCRRDLVDEYSSDGFIAE